LSRSPARRTPRYDARDDYDDVVDDCASVATGSTMGYEKDDDGEFGA
jgi:hypothetical protein